MLTLSERWFTTQTYSFVRAATATGSKPTMTAPRWCKPYGRIRKTSRRLSGVLTANSVEPSGVSASGRTWPDSNKVKEERKAGRSGAHTREQQRTEERQMPEKTDGYVHRRPPAIGGRSKRPPPDQSPTGGTSCASPLALRLLAAHGEEVPVIGYYSVDDVGDEILYPAKRLVKQNNGRKRSVFTE